MSHARANSIGSDSQSDDEIEMLMETIGQDVAKVCDEHSQERGNALYSKRLRIVFSISGVSDTLVDCAQKLDKLKEMVLVLPFRELDTRLQNIGRTHIFSSLGELLHGVAEELSAFERLFSVPALEDKEEKIPQTPVQRVVQFPSVPSHVRDLPHKMVAMDDDDDEEEEATTRKGKGHRRG